MRATAVILALLALFALSQLPGAPVAAQPRPHVATTKPRTPAEEQKGFHLPPGFVIELVASEPAIHKPINIDFDDRGRLWVTESVEYPFPAADADKARDCVKVLESTRKDGVYDKVTTFADRLNIPIGVLPTATGAIIHSIPKVWSMVDTKGKGQADKREELLGTFGFQDTHGMTGNFNWGFDGRVYATHGFANRSVVKARDGSTLTMHSGNTYRFQQDGTKLEQFTWGQVNPFGLCFDPLGNLYSADCETKPVYQLLRGGHYPGFGTPHDSLGFAPEMCPHKHGSSAIAGIVYYAADQFPPEYRGTIFLGNVVTCRINHDKIQWHGSSPRAIEQPDFLTSDDPWFRPVCMKLGPDGALYVADFYNRIIGHYEVRLDHPGRDRERGRIWRIWYKGTDGKNKLPASRDLSKASIPDLVKELADPNLTVRTFATNLLASRDAGKVKAALAPVMKPGSSPFQRMHGLWVLERTAGLADETLLAAVADKDPGVCVHALRVLSERKELTAPQLQAVRAALGDKDANVQRAAADALGQHPLPENVRPLLDLLARVPAADTHLNYVVRMALRDQFRPEGSWSKLPDPWKEADARALADVAPGVASAQAGTFLLQHMQKVAEPPHNLARYLRHGARHVPAELQGKLVEFARGKPGKNIRDEATYFRAVQQGSQERGGPLIPTAQQWGKDLTARLLAAKEHDLLIQGADLAGSLKLKEEQKTLQALARRADLPEQPRKSACSALATIDPQASIAFLGGLLRDARVNPAVREHTANVLSGINRPAARGELVAALPTAPGRLQSVIAAGLAGNKEGASMLLDAIAAGKASPRLLQEWPVRIRMAQTKLPGHEKRITELTAGLPAAEARLEKLLQQRKAGFQKSKPDLAKGALIFEKSCAVCHQMAGKGAKIGPQLDGIGNRGIDRLLEDIVDPNRNVDQAFRASTLSLKNGQVKIGLVLREEGETVILADNEGKEIRIPKNSIAERSQSLLSPMPANFVDQVPEADFYHLLAFLLAQQTPGPEKK